MLHVIFPAFNFSFQCFADSLVHGRSDLTAAPEAAAAAPVAATTMRCETGRRASERQPNVLAGMPGSGPSRTDDQGLHVREAARKSPAIFSFASTMRATIRIRSAELCLARHSPGVDGEMIMARVLQFEAQAVVKLTGMLDKLRQQRRHTCRPGVLDCDGIHSASALHVRPHVPVRENSSQT